MGNKARINLSFFLKTATKLKIKPISPNAAIAKTGSGKKNWIFIQIKIIKATASHIDHLPVVVLGKIVSFMTLSNL